METINIVEGLRLNAANTRLICTSNFLSLLCLLRKEFMGVFNVLTIDTPFVFQVGVGFGGGFRQCPFPALS